MPGVFLLLLLCFALLCSGCGRECSELSPAAVESDVAEKTAAPENTGRPEGTAGEKEPPEALPSAQDSEVTPSVHAPAEEVRVQSEPYVPAINTPDAPVPATASRSESDPDAAEWVVFS